MGDICNDTSVIRSISESGGGFDFGKHRTGFEIAIAFEIVNFLNRNMVEGFGIGGAVINIDIRYGGDRDEDVGID